MARARATTSAVDERLTERDERTKNHQKNPYIYTKNTHSMTQHTLYKDLKHLEMYNQARGRIRIATDGCERASRAVRHTRARVEIRRSDIDSLADI